MTMIHKFKYKEDYFILDVASGAIHVVDQNIYDMIDEESLKDRDYYIQKFKSKTDTNIICECYDELKKLQEEGSLYSNDTYTNDIVKKYEAQPNSVKSLCLNIAHDCNLMCKYCFADGEGYDDQEKLMPLEVAKRSVDFLIAHSGSRKNLEVDFFGGEPLLNMDVVKKTVEYAKSLEKQHNKHFRFTITTNSTLLNEEIMDYLEHNMINIVLSIDGRKKVHDNIRITKNKKGSYDMILPKIQKMVEKRHQSHKQYYIRGTFTSNNLDFSEDVKHFIDLGFKEISIEPVVLPADHELAIQENHLEQIFKQYDIICDELIKHKDVIFYHFNINIYGGPCIYKRISGCGAGFDYVAVTPDGDIFPCHQFVGNKDFYLGNVFEGKTNQTIATSFKELHIYNKPECKNCWARFFCSGGCQANHYNFNRDFKIPYSIACQMQKKRIECAIALQYYRNNNISEVK
ncbi:thioether cross-link-forming SCIFF peptide maturase [Crassaminicella profunda]|uniref:thioether cross-link-forming SCIFF peptide maturase n=1 Tax=Crassaminicella profunda TaxID=1286698 RepID=UPI001CA62952|nr:thioether cross-link-forming SCIFF peptide maturase [Crassaminicella profunda]QZY54424.1 thioether cross-link-forming SCIFF peptide maturase [Crassaminicella profunda]